MHYRRLGKWGLKVSEISLGSWITFGTQIDDQTAVDLVHFAYDQGVNFFDNADINAHGQAEIIMGKAIEGLPREALVISSKVFWPTMPGPNGRGLSRKHVSESINASLQRLGLDYLDLYFCHRYDPDTAYEEVAYTMNTLIQQGKILYWGTSEWQASQIATLHGICRQYHLIPPAVEQPQYNMFHRRRVEIELSPICHDRGLGLTVWGPLYSGILSGKYQEGEIPEESRAAQKDMGWVRDRLTPERLDRISQLSTLASEIGITTAQLAIAWLLRRKEVSSVITGATTVEQLQENLAAGEWVDHLTEPVLERIEQILGNLPTDE